MGLIELFRQKQIHISPESAVKVEYITLPSSTDLYILASDALVLVKRQLTMKDAQGLQLHKGILDVFTMKPESLDALDAGKEVEQFASLYIIDSVGLSFLHSGESLYVFDDSLDCCSLPNTPNVVRLSPVYRNDIDTYLSIDDTLLAAINSEKRSINDEIEIPEDMKKPLQIYNPKQDELSLLRKKTSELFSSRYTEVRVEFSGTAPENRTISLSAFYEKHGIERGQLKGSWSIFEKKNRKDIIDAGIVNKAKEVELNKVSVSVPTYGRIIRSVDLELLREKMVAIEQDYRSYLDGVENCKKVGSIAVQKRFSPADIIEKSFSRLEEYLHRIGVDINADDSYHNAVDTFIRNEWRKQKPFSEFVSLQITSSTYTESQWANADFLDRFLKTVCDHRYFFDDEFLNILDRYIRLMNHKE